MSLGNALVKTIRPSIEKHKSGRPLARKRADPIACIARVDWRRGVCLESRGWIWRPEWVCTTQALLCTKVLSCPSWCPAAKVLMCLLYCDRALRPAANQPIFCSNFIPTPSATGAALGNWTFFTQAWWLYYVFLIRQSGHRRSSTVRDDSCALVWLFCFANLFLSSKCCTLYFKKTSFFNLQLLTHRLPPPGNGLLNDGVEAESRQHHDRWRREICCKRRWNIF